MKSNHAVLIVHDIRSAQNVGSLFRTADAIGIEKIYLSSISPTPLDRFGRPVGTIAKTALGAEKHIPWESYIDITELISSLKADGFHIIAIEQSPKAIDYKHIQADECMAFVVGNEVEGIPSRVLSLVDTIAEIPMLGSKESLNVAVSAGIALFRILDR